MHERSFENFSADSYIGPMVVGGKRTRRSKCLPSGARCGLPWSFSRINLCTKTYLCFRVSIVKTLLNMRSNVWKHLFFRMIYDFLSDHRDRFLSSFGNYCPVKFKSRLMIFTSFCLLLSDNVSLTIFTVFSNLLKSIQFNKNFLYSETRCLKLYFIVFIFRPHAMGEENHILCCIFSQFCQISTISIHYLIILVTSSIKVVK